MPSGKFSGVSWSYMLNIVQPPNYEYHEDGSQYECFWKPDPGLDLGVDLGTFSRNCSQTWALSITGKVRAGFKNGKNANSYNPTWIQVAPRHVHSINRTLH